MSAEFARKLFYFPTPEISESFNFEKCFHCSAGEESVGQYVKDLTINRDKLKASLHTSNDHNSASLLADIDAYMPLIWQLLDSLDRQEPVKIETPLRFVWKGAIIRGFSKIDSTVFTDVIFEVIMTLHTKAIVTANLAAELSESDPSAVNTAAKYLRQSSSIMKYLASSLIPRWHTKINYRLTPSETNVTYCAYLSEFFSACSNQMCVAKAMQNGSTPPTLLTSLCLSVVRGMETCLNNLQTSGVILKDTDSGSRDHVGVMREFFSVLVYRYQADTYMKSHDTGIVIALCAVVQARINSTSDSKHFDPFKPAQFPKISHQSPGLRSALAEVGDFIARMRAVAEEENKLVYFKAVPHDTSQLPELPAPTILNLPSEPFNPPSSEVVCFSYDPSRKSTVFNSFTNLFFSQSKSSSNENTHVEEEGQPTTEGDSTEVTEIASDVGAITLTRVPSDSASNTENPMVDEDSVKRLMDMGFVAEVSRNVLLKHKGNETAAVNELLSSK